MRDSVLYHRAFTICRIFLIRNRFFGYTRFIPVLFLFLDTNVVEVDVDALHGLFIGFLSAKGFPRFFNIKSRKSFFTHVFTNSGQRRLKRLFFKIGRFLYLLDGRAFRPRHTVRFKSMLLEYALAFSSKKINYLKPFRLGTIAQRVQRRATGFLVAATVEHLGGLPVTTLRGGMCQ